MRWPTHSPHPGAAISRRATLGLALGGTTVLGATLSGCDLRGLGDLDPVLGGSPSPAATSPDVALTERVLADVEARLAAVVAAGAGAPVLRDALSGLQAMHEAHRAVLLPVTEPTASRSTRTSTSTSTSQAPSPTTSAGPTAPVRRPARALRRLRTAETAHQAALVEAAVAADSGSLARLLASMSASVAQHLAVLPTEPAAS